MDMQRRGFFGKMAAAGVGVAALFRAAAARAKALPSDPDRKPPKRTSDEVIELPPFEKDGLMTLEESLLARKTDRKYDADASLEPEQLSRLLWATNGVNRDDGHRTTPSAVARYPVDVLIALPEGVYRFDHEAHRLIQVTDEDIRKEIPIQFGFRKAAAIVLYVVRKDKLSGMEPGWADLEIGCMVQSLYLQAAAMDLGCCVFALVKYDDVTQLLGLDEDDEKLRIAQAVGPLR